MAQNPFPIGMCDNSEEILSDSIHIDRKIEAKNMRPEGGVCQDPFFARKMA
jgi:hypothetical protein